MEKAAFGAYVHILPVCYYWIMKSYSECSCGGAEKCVKKICLKKKKKKCLMKRRFVLICTEMFHWVGRNLCLFL